MQSLNIPQFIKDNITLRQESLLAKDLEHWKQDLQERIDQKSVLVIGGAGTIGSSYIKALLQFKPSKLVVVDTNENGLTELTRDLRSSTGLNIPDDYKAYPFSFGSQVFQRFFKKEGPFDIVANFAAHKHVRSEKDAYSIEAMIRNNVIATQQLLDLLLEYPPEHFFCVSTDKAANPVNVMGASKKLMEEVIMAYTDRIPITTARFANVAFSNGSLLAGFLERLMKQQPFSSPLDVRRYFVSPEESGQLCLLACMLGESGTIFFPKLKEEQMMRFSEIGTALLQQLDLEAVQCPSEEDARIMAHRINSNTKQYPVYYFPSDTSGEKMYEEFYTSTETIDWERFNALGIIQGNTNKTILEIQNIVHELEVLFDKHGTKKQEIIQLLSKFLPTFRHVEKGKNLDQRM